MPTALIVGCPGARRDPVIKLLKARCQSLGYDAAEVRSYVHAPSRCSTLDTSITHLIFFCMSRGSGRGLDSLKDHLRAIKAPSRRVIVYAHTSCASSIDAVDLFHQELADGYLVNGELRTEDSLEELLTSLRTRGEPHYTPIEINPPVSGDSPKVFISTPFEASTLLLAKRAIEYPLTLLNFSVRWGAGDYHHSLQDNILTEIRSSSLIVANVSVDRRVAGDNPNVYFELGAAAMQDLPIVLVRKVGERTMPLPADIQGRRWMSYDNETDLALKLYCGLKRARSGSGSGGLRL